MVLNLILSMSWKCVLFYSFFVSGISQEDLKKKKKKAPQIGRPVIGKLPAIWSCRMVTTSMNFLRPLNYVWRAYFCTLLVRNVSQEVENGLFSLIEKKFSYCIWIFYIIFIDIEKFIVDNKLTIIDLLNYYGVFIISYKGVVCTVGNLQIFDRLKIR